MDECGGAVAIFMYSQGEAHGARDRPRLQRVRDRRTGTAVVPGDVAGIVGTGDSSDARRLLRRVHDGRFAVFAGLHEVRPHIVFRKRGLVRTSWIRRFSWLRGSESWRRLRVRHQPNGDNPHRGSARPRAAKRGVLYHPTGTVGRDVHTMARLRARSTRKSGQRA
jgi:hypothetical protein